MVGLTLSTLAVKKLVDRIIRRRELQKHLHESKQYLAQVRRNLFGGPVAADILRTGLAGHGINSSKICRILLDGKAANIVNFSYELRLNGFVYANSFLEFTSGV